MKNKRLFTLVAMALTLSLLFSACGNFAGGKETTAAKPVDIMQTTDPSEDDDFNVLMIGSSFCYYYVEELYGLLAEQYPDKTVRVCNVYQSGCSINQHWTWRKNNESHYFFYTTDESGRKEVRQTNLDYCLSQQNWDVISLQEGTSSIYKTGVQEHLAKAKPQLDDLWGYLKEQFPMSRHLWHAPWSYQIGFDKNGYAMETPEQQSSNIKTVREFGQEVCKLYDLELVNTGDAWQIVRDGGYDNLCARKGVDDGKGDYQHDGDIGGGQYLNACVWFEIITGQSCVGKTYRPNYQLDANITYEALQQAAHQAVENLKTANN